MRVPLSWLSEFVEVEAEVAEICDRLTVAGLEVEKVERYAPSFSGVYVAKVLKVERHPNADRLSLCEVDVGERGRFTVVCGAPNARAGMIGALAMVGARLAGPGKDNPDGSIRFEEVPPLEAATIRGVRSEGMLCSERELNLSEEQAGIIELERSAPLGADVGAYLKLNDTVLEIAITPNRGDCLSILGVAREVAALFGAKLKPPRFKPLTAVESDKVKIEIAAPELCPRYAGLTMNLAINGKVRMGKTPRWMKRRLELSAIRSLNTVVDVTNYVMLELGQPLHAFDLARISGGKIVVRRADQDKEFATLDGARRELQPSDLMIADATKPLAIAGVMGGLESEVSESTTEILLESAYFEPITIARTSRRLGLHSEASHRFERGVDRDGQARAIMRAAELIRKLGRGRQSSQLTDVQPQVMGYREVELEVGRIESLLGVKIAASDSTRRLKALGAKVARAGRGKLKVIPPSFRPDLNQPEDLIEEIARLRGLAEIPSELPARRKPVPADEPGRALTRRTRQILLGAGLTEIRTMPFTAPATNLAFPGLIAGAAPVRVLNPISAELSELRLSLLGEMLGALRFNLNREAHAFHAFELSKVFYREGPGTPKEAERIAAVSYGDYALGAIGRPAAKSSFFTLKGILEAYLRSIGLLDRVEFEHAAAEAVPYLHPGKSADVTLGGKHLGFLGELHPQESSRLELREVCVIFELDFTEFITYGSPANAVTAPPRFPAIRRDLALVLDRDFPAGAVVKTLSHLDVPLLESVELFDAYEGDQVPAGKKSLALSLSYRAADRTLTDEEVNRTHAGVIREALTRLNAELRQ